MAKFIGTKKHSFMNYLPHLLLLVGVILMIAGIASMQEGDICSDANANSLFSGDSINYLAPVDCDRFFSFDWFITFWVFFVWLVLLFFIISRTVHKARNALTGLLLTSTVLTVFMTNTWFKPWGGFGDAFTNSFVRRAKVAFAGALLASIANILLLLGIGLHDEKASDEERRGTTGTHDVYVTESVPVGTTGTTYVSQPATTTSAVTGRRGGDTF